MKKISNEDFQALVSPLLGLTISHPWPGYGSTIFLELGRLRPPSDSRFRHPEGEAHIEPGYYWRVVDAERILFGSSDSGPKIDKGLSLLAGLQVSSIELFLTPSEIFVTLSNGVKLQSMAAASGDPEWSIKLLDGTYLHYKDSSLIQVAGDEALGGQSDEEIEAFNIADEATSRWGQPFVEPKLGDCSQCKYFIQLDGEFILRDYGICAASGSPFDGRAVHTSSGCPKYAAFHPRPR